MEFPLPQSHPSQLLCTAYGKAENYIKHLQTIYNSQILKRQYDQAVFQHLKFQQQKPKPNSPIKPSFFPKDLISGQLSSHLSLFQQYHKRTLLKKTNTKSVRPQTSTPSRRPAFSDKQALGLKYHNLTGKITMRQNKTFTFEDKFVTKTQLRRRQLTRKFTEIRQEFFQLNKKYKINQFKSKTPCVAKSRLAIVPFEKFLTRRSPLEIRTLVQEPLFEPSMTIRQATLMKRPKRKQQMSFTSHGKTESSWENTYKNLEEKLKMLSFKRQELMLQKKNVESLRNRQTNLSRKDISLEELKMVLELTQQQLQDASSALRQQKQQRFKFEQQIRSLKIQLEESQKINKNLTTQLFEKQTCISRLLSLLLQVKQHMSNEEIIFQINQFIRKINQQDPQQFFLESLHQKFQSQFFNVPTEASVDQTETIRLKRQLKETQDLYKLSNDQLADQAQKFQKQQEELSNLRRKLEQTRNDYQSLSSSMLKHSSDSDYQMKSLLVQLEALRRKKDEFDTEIHRREQKQKQIVESLQTDLGGSRERVLSLLEDKKYLQNQVAQLKAEKSELLADQQAKIAKYEDLIANNYTLEYELDILRKGGFDTQETRALKGQIRELTEKHVNQRYKYEVQTQELKQKIEQLQAKLETGGSQKASSELLQQMSYIILSKDPSQVLDSKAKLLLKQVFGDDCTKLVQKNNLDLKKANKQLLAVRKKASYDLSRLSDQLSEKKEILQDLYKLSPRTEYQGKLQLVERQIRQIEKQLQNPNYRPKIHTQKAQKKKLKNENSQLKSDLMQALTQLQCSPDTSDFLAFIRCEAQSLEKFLIK